MNLFKSLTGMVRAELTTGDVGKTLGMAARKQITLSKVHSTGPLTLEFEVSRRDYRRFQQLAGKRGDELRPLGRSGLYWKARSLIMRPALAGGLLLVLLFFLFLPSRIYFIEVTGNRKIPAELIRQTAMESGLPFGVSRRTLRSGEIANHMLTVMPELSWVGINTRGCVAQILVEEKEPLRKKQEEQKIFGITADRDGIIDSCTALKGTLLCAPGQAVAEGQLLISPYVSAGTHMRVLGAEGEIYGRTRHIINAVIPLEKTVRRKKTHRIRRYGLVIGKKRINFPWNSGIPDASCGRMYEEYCITLPGGYQLPVLLTLDQYITYDTAVSRLWEPEAQTVLETGASRYLREQMIAGTILQSSVKPAPGEGVLRQTGTYLCREMLGRCRQEKIGETYGKNH